MSLRARLDVEGDVLDEAAAARCRACGADGLVGFFSVAGVPTQSCVLLESADEALSYPSGDVVLGFCEVCGFVENVRFDPGRVDYSKPTEESQAYSAQFQRFAAELARDLVRRHRLEGRTVLEVGCGKGDFLVLLAELGIGRGVGIDPGFLPDRAVGGGANLEFIRDWYTDEHTHLTGDLVVTRHLLEHVPDVAAFTRLLRKSVTGTPGAGLFVEVPDVRRVLAGRAFWDIYYEHCSYFSLGSLGRMLRAEGFEVRSLDLAFGDQYLLAEVVPGAPGPPHPSEEPVEELAEEVVRFVTAARPAIQGWRERLGRAASGGRRIAIWGGGSKAVAFLATIRLPVDGVVVVDINPHKQGKYLPGSGHRVEAPASLVADPPDLVVVMNRIYEEEIRSDLAGMGLAPEVVAL